MVISELKLKNIFIPETFLLLFIYSGEFKGLFSSSILANNGFLVITLFLCLFSCLFYIKKIVFTKGLFFSFLSFCLLLLTIYFNYNFFSYGIKSSEKFTETITILPAIALVGITLNNSKESYKRLLNSILLVSGVLCLIFLTNYASNSFTGGALTKSYQRTGILSALGFVASWIRIENNNRDFYKYIGLFLCSFFFISLLLSSHRAGIFCLLFSVLYLLGSRIKTYFKTKSIAIIGGITFLIYLFLVRFFDEIALVRRMVFAYYNFEEYIRILMLKRSFEEAANNIFFGGGFGMFEQLTGISGYRHPHNFFAEILLELGLIGLILYLITYFGWVIQKGAKAPKRALIAIFICCITYACFSGDISEHRLLLFTAFLLRK